MYHTLSHAQSMSESDDAVSEHADALDLELDHVPAPEPAAVPVLEDAARPDGSRAEDVAGPQPCVACGLGNDRVPGVVQVAELSAGALLAVHPCDHRGAR